MAGKTLGIDLGTTRSVVANIAENKPEIVEIDGARITRSVVHIEDEDNAVVGREADKKLEMSPEQTVEEIKKQMGEDVELELGDRNLTPEEISAIIIEYLVKEAEDRLGEDIEDVVITIPAYFGQERSTATATAGEIADVNVESLLPEPSAACLAYGFENDQLDNGNEELVFVYDLGGGTFDATLVDVDYEVNYLETINIDGDDNLGGSDWTNAIVEWVIAQIEQDTGVDVTEKPKQMGRIISEAREAKHMLSREKEVSLVVPFVVPEEDYSFEAELTRDKFEDLTGDLLERTRDPMEDLFSRSEHEIDDVDKVILAGGATRMPQIPSLVEDYFDQEPSREINPDEAVALGAAIQAEVLGDGDTEVSSIGPGGHDEGGIIIEEALPKPLGVRLHDGSIDTILENDVSIPASERKEEYGTVREDQKVVQIEIYQGEGDHADDENVDKIGEAVLGENDPIPSRDPGEPTLACGFEVNSDKKLQAQGEDLISGKEVETTINLEIDKTSEEVKQMKKGLPSVE